MEKSRTIGGPEIQAAMNAAADGAPPDQTTPESTKVITPQEAVTDTAESGTETQESAEVTRARQAVADWKGLYGTGEFQRFLDASTKPSSQYAEYNFGKPGENNVLTKMFRFVDKPLQRDNGSFWNKQGLITPDHAKAIAPQLPNIEATIKSIQVIGGAKDIAFDPIPEAEAFIGRQYEHYSRTLQERTERFINDMYDKKRQTIPSEQWDAFRNSLEQYYHSPEFEGVITRRLVPHMVTPAAALDNSLAIKKAFTGVKFPGLFMAPEDIPEYIDPLVFDRFAEPPQKKPAT